jgi:hypothetical protein
VAAIAQQQWLPPITGCEKIRPEFPDYFGGILLGDASIDYKTFCKAERSGSQLLHGGGNAGQAIFDKKKI